MLSILDVTPYPQKKRRTGADAAEAEPKADTSQRSVPVSEPVDMPEAPPPKAQTPKTKAPKDKLPDAAPPESGAPGNPDEYELVLGRRQIASCLFAGTVLIAIFTTGAYFAGKASTPIPIAASSVPEAPVPPASLPATPTVPQPVGDGQGATPFVAEPAAETKTDAAGEHPLFAHPQNGALYLQMGAVDRSMAMFIVEGLRAHGFTAFVAPGPDQKTFRVLVGPFANQDDYKRTKAEVDAIDVTTFTQQFQK